MHASVKKNKKMARVRVRVLRRCVAAAAVALSGSTASAFVVSGPSRAGLRSEVSIIV